MRTVLTLLSTAQPPPQPQPPAYKAYPGLNCYDGHGGVNIDTKGSSSPPHTNVSIDECARQVAAAIPFVLAEPQKHRGSSATHARGGVRLWVPWFTPLM